MPQVAKMTTKEFLAFVQRPRHIDDTDGIILHAENDESSKRNYFLNCCLFCPTIIGMLSISFYYSENIFAFA